MLEDEGEPVAEVEAACPLAPARYKLVGIEEGVTRIGIPLLARDYALDEFTPELFELLHRLGWPHVEKSY